MVRGGDDSSDSLEPPQAEEEVANSFKIILELKCTSSMRLLQSKPKRRPPSICLDERLSPHSGDECLALIGAIASESECLGAYTM